MIESLVRIIIGADRPGLVEMVAARVADLSQARARGLVPATVKLENVRRELERIATDLLVDLKLRTLA